MTPPAATLSAICTRAGPSAPPILRTATYRPVQLPKTAGRSIEVPRAFRTPGSLPIASATPDRNGRAKLPCDRAGVTPSPLDLREAFHDEAEDTDDHERRHEVPGEAGDAGAAGQVIENAGHLDAPALWRCPAWRFLLP